MSRKLISVLLSVLILFSLCIPAAANNATHVNVLHADDSVLLDYDVPVISVEGFGLDIYKGLSTADESDDEVLGAVSAENILGYVKKYGLKLLVALFTKNYNAVTDILTEVITPIFGEIACDENGVPSPDTGIKALSDTQLKDGFGYENSYDFRYDWRKDMHTLAAELDEYIKFVMELTDSEQVVLTSFSMGNCILTTYLYEYYYTASDYAQRDHIKAVIFISSAANGVDVCGDPFSGNMSVDSTSLMRFLSEVMTGDETSSGIYNLLEILYSLGILEPVAEYANNLVKNVHEYRINDVVIDNIGTIPGLYALMSDEQYEQCEDFIFDTAEKREKYSGLLEKNRYYHDSVQSNAENIIDSLIADGINTAIIAEYGFTSIPLTSSNDRQSDGTISTASASFGATCSDVDGTLGKDYVQKIECECGNNHISPDNQIDASTCSYPDITWFAKNLRHTAAARYFSGIVNVVAYSDRQITVWDYSDYPQYLTNYNDEYLVPLTADNTQPVIAYEESLSNIFAKAKKLF